MSYKRFALMILASTVAMFGLMYLNTYALEHVFFSETRVYMAIVMGAVMAPIMLLFMWGMYQGKGIKFAILLGSVILFSLSLWLVRSQVTVDDRAYMRAMIPHHSIAIMTSERADITDLRTRKLADEIIEAQEREISEMRFLIADIGENGKQQAVYEDPAAQPGSMAEALSAAARARLDPGQMTPEEVAQLVPTAVCAFRQTESAPPIFVSDRDTGGIKLNNVLVTFEAASNAVWSADGTTVTLSPDADPGVRATANLVFAMQDGPTVGYRGFWSCTD
ncbi:DUF6692 family protein [Paracoccus yeei]|uniref:DUF6692 family protein n=1 Tax=Paracoccus yeei TaxID=147645 RepID=UPI0037CFD599